MSNTPHVRDDEPVWLARVGHDAAKYAVENWHYSERLPSGKRVTYGVWEYGTFIGVVIFSRGAAPNIASPYGLTQTDVCECTRVALTDHDAPVSQILSVALRLLERENPGIRVVVSYADPKEDHDGTIYQAANWYYEGQLDSRDYIAINGTTHHPRSLNGKYGTSSVPKLRDMAPDDVTIERVPVPGKHKYSYAFDDAVAERIAARAKPYP